MAWIREEDMLAIRQKADIVDILSNYITLTKKGKNYVAVCPFHDDHDPSLSISTDKQIFKCFVCGTGGDVFTFVQKIENITFTQAVVKVAQLVNYPLDIPFSATEKRIQKFQAEYDLLEDYIQFMNYELYSEEGSQALNYLHSRKFSDELIGNFSLGYAPFSQKSLHYFSAKHYSQEQLNEVGLLSSSQSAFFSNRVVIPIHDAQGNPVGFSARRLSDNSDEPKYINTTQTKIYEKGKLIFNYHRAKEHARKAHRVILVEGAMDVFGFEKAGVHEAIACLGTACTEDQIRLIQQLQVPVVVYYDNDKAGKEATYKFGKLAVKNHILFTIVKNDLAKDPDDIFIEFGKGELEKSVNKTISFVEFLIDYLPFKYNLSNYEDKKNYAEELSKYIELTCQSFEKNTYYSILKQKTGFDFSNIQPGKAEKKKKNSAPVYLPIPESGRKRAEYIALWFMIHSRRATQRFKEEIGFFKDEECNQLSLYVYDQYRNHEQLKTEELFASILEEEVRNLLATLIMNPFHYDPLNENFFEDSLLKIKECTLQDQIDLLNQKIEQLSDPLKKIETATLKQQLILQRNRIRNRKEG